MAHLHLPDTVDPTTRAWLKLDRRERRAAMHDARAHMKSRAFIEEYGQLTKAQRRAATPWQPILLNPADAHVLSGRGRADQSAMCKSGLNRAARRRLKAKSRGPSMRAA